MAEIKLTKDAWDDSAKWPAGTVVGQCDNATGEVIAAPDLSPARLQQWITAGLTSTDRDSVLEVTADPEFESPAVEICRKIREANELVIEDQKAVVERE